MDDNRLVIRPKKQKGDDGYKTFSIRIKDETVDKLDNVVQLTGHSRNELIGILIEYALAHCVIEEK